MFIHSFIHPSLLQPHSCRDFLLVDLLSFPAYHRPLFLRPNRKSLKITSHHHFIIQSLSITVIFITQSTPMSCDIIKSKFPLELVNRIIFIFFYLVFSIHQSSFCCAVILIVVILLYI